MLRVLSRSAAVLLLGSALLHGCTLVEPQTTPVDLQVHRQPPPSPPTPTPRYEGSLFVGESGRSLLFVDRKARQVNDIVTIRIVEVATASGRATTGTSRDSSITGQLTGLFGAERSLQNAGVPLASAVAGGLANSYDGQGATTRSNSVTATITAVIREVFPNNNLYLEGYKEVIINNERQHILLSGVIRPEDIAPDNSIRSDQIADVRMVYSGRGAVSDKQRPGWAGRILDFVWPF